jgi:tetratricopeptide (TPR) repeat protein
MMNDKKEKLEKAPNSLIFVSLASMYLDNGMIDEAIDLCKAGLEIEPQNEEAHLILARAEIEKGDRESARKRLIDILERNPENSSAKELLDQIRQVVVEKEESRDVDSKVQIIAEEKVIQAEKREKDAEKELGSSMETEKMGVEVGKEEKVEGKDSEEVIDEVPLEIKEPERGVEEEESLEEEQDTGEFDEFYVEKIKKITSIEGVINCFFRLVNGRIIKNPQLVGNIKELFPLLDSLLSTVKNTGERLKMGEVEIIMIEIEKGVFYIFETEKGDCFIISKHAENFGLLKVLVPKILSENSSEGEEDTP